MKIAQFFFLFLLLLFRVTPSAHEVPRLGVKLELQLPAYTTATANRDLSRSATYTTAHGNAGSPTH